MSALPPHEHRHHHELHAGPQSLPREQLPAPGKLDIPIAPNLSIEAQDSNGSEFPVKPVPHRRYDFRNLREVRGAIMLWLRIPF